MNWYKMAIEIKWTESPDNSYLHLEPDTSLIPIDNMFIPNKEYNPVYKDVLDRYRREMIIGLYSTEPPKGILKQELTQRNYEEFANSNFWMPISNNPQMGKPYALIYNGVHRVLAAQKAGASEIKVIRDLGRSSEWF